MKVYRGTTKVFFTPDIKPYGKLLDYGSGFYTSADLEFEEKIAAEREYRIGGCFCVDSYNFSNEIAEKILSIKKFSNDSLEWVYYMLANRSGRYDGPEYDIIYAPAPDLEDYKQIKRIEQKMGWELHIHRYIKKKKRPLRIIFKTPKSLNLLKFVLPKVHHQKKYEYEEEIDMLLPRPEDSREHIEYEKDILPNLIDISGELDFYAEDIVRYAAIKTGMPCRELIIKLYSSKLFRDLSDKKLMAWRFSYAALGEMFISEIKTGSFIYPDADKILKLEESYYIYALEMYRKAENISAKEAIGIFEKYNVFEEVKNEYAYYCSPPTMTYESIKEYIEKKKTQKKGTF